ncbi:MAG: TM0106 family RecB-like putative nuclease [Patescibacteria group bacterium]
MRPRITEHTFYQYLKCPSWVAHDARAGHLEDVLRQRLQEDGLLPEVERRLLAKRQVVEVVEEDMDDAAVRTVEYMQSGVQTIYRGVLVHGHFVARPDILERVEGKSEFGAYYYVACDIKRSRHLKEEYKLQGCFYAEVLALIQKLKPVQGYVMHPNGEVESYLLAEVAKHYHLTLDSIERILDGEDEPHFLTSDCKQSPWFHECKKDAISCDDLSRLNRVWRSEVQEFNAAGFATVTDLAALHPDLIASKVAGVSRDRLEFLYLQAKALATNQHFILRTADLPKEDIALIVDVESDPLRDVHYLFGVLEVNGKDEKYHAFLAKDPKDEQRAWEEFIAFMRGYIGTPIYHYGWSEQDVFRSMGAKYGTDQEVLAMLEEQSIDILVRLRECIVFPLSFYSLKDIAQYIGFKWRHEQASGLNSVLWFEDWLNSGNKQALQDVIDYNEDDVRATWALRNWALKHS